MPVIKSAKKKLRQDRKKQLENKKVKNTFKAAVKAVRTNPSSSGVQEAFSQLDKAAKKGVIHKNKAARLKSSLSKLLPSKKAETSVKEPKKTTTKK